MGMGCGMSMVKYILFVFNLLCAVSVGFLFEKIFKFFKFKPNDKLGNKIYFCDGSHDIVQTSKVNRLFISNQN